MLFVEQQRHQTVEEFLDDVRRHGTQNGRSIRGVTTLCFAIDKFRSTYLVEELLKDGAAVNAFTCCYSYPYCGCELGAGTRYELWGDFTPVHLAVSLGHYEIVKLLCDYGADVQLTTTKGIRSLDFLLNKPLLRFQEKGTTLSEADDFQVLQILKTAGADLDTEEKTFHQSTLLHRATELNIPEITRYLIGHGCDVNSVDTDGKTPLHYSSVTVAVECARILLHNGANPNAQDKFGNTTYHERKLENSSMSLDFLRMLHEFRVDPNVPNDVGKTALHLCLEKIVPRVNVEEVIDVMLTFGADPNIPDDLERTPVYNLIKYSTINTLDEWRCLCSILLNLLHHGARLMERDITGTQLLHSLVRRCLSFPEYLDSKLFMKIFQRKYKVDVNSQDIHNRTVLHLVASEGNWAMAEIFLDLGANMEIEDCDGNTPLHVAILCERWEFARELLLWPLRTADIVDSTRRNDCTERLSHNDDDLKQVYRSNSVPALIYSDDLLARTSHSSHQLSTKEFRQDVKKRSDEIHRTVSLGNFTVPEQVCVTSLPAQCNRWTAKNVDMIAKYIDRDGDVFLEELGRREIYCCDIEIQPAASTTRKDLVNQINKSSLFQLCEENSVGEFHLYKDCQEEHCLIAKQVFRLIKDLLEKCSEIDPKMESNLFWTGSSAEGTKLWLPDEFDFLMELVQLQSEFRFTSTSSGDVFVKRECQELWSDLCVSKKSRILCFTNLKKYITTLLWKAASLLDRKKYKNIYFRLCRYNKKMHTFINKTKVGINFKVCWYGKKYKKLMVSIDLTPAISAFITDETIEKMKRVNDQCIHVVPYVFTHETWRPSFSLREVEAIKRLPPKQIALYKCLKFLRDIHKEMFPEIPSYYLKTFILNMISSNSFIFYTESTDALLSHILRRLCKIARKSRGARRIEHFFLRDSLELDMHDMSWVQSSLNLLEKS